MDHSNHTFEFVKMHGIGNDYVFIDDRIGAIEDPHALAQVIADRHTGVGGDGLILACAPTSADADLRMRMFNADGSESEMCGNGIRCLCRFAHDDLGITSHPMHIETGAGVLTLTYECDERARVTTVSVDMGMPTLELPEIGVDPAALTCCGEDLYRLNDVDIPYEMSFVSMGNPHAIALVDDVHAVDLAVIGPVVEHHAAFPQRINMHVVQCLSRTHVRMRTWERGSGVTLACGTGASAVCVALARRNLTERCILASLPGGDLELHWCKQRHHVIMTGPAEESFRGTWSRAQRSVDGNRIGTPVRAM